MPAIQNAETIWARRHRKLQDYWINHFQNHVTIVLYHRVTKTERDTLELEVTPETFEKHINWYKNKFNIITADELADIVLHKKKIPAKSLLITFDDGYADNYLEALPILESNNVPALFFISSSKLGTPELFWWDELEFLVFNYNTLPPEIRIDDDEIIQTKERTLLFDNIHQRLKYGSLEQRNFILQNIRSQFTGEIENRKNYRIMTTVELKSLASSPLVTIGAHTLNHLSLSVQEPAIQKKEITENKIQLEDIIKKPIKFFAYPYGSTKDFNNTTIKQAGEAGFKLSFANYHGFCSSATHPHKIPRILIRDWDTDELSRQLNKSF